MGENPHLMFGLEMLRHTMPKSTSKH